MMQVLCSGCKINDGCMVHDLKPPTVTYTPDMSLCRECGFYGCQCKKEQSHGMDFESENKHLDEDKAWGEFIEWATEEWPYRNVLHAFSYDRLLDYEQVGMLIEYLKTKEGFNSGEGYIIDYLTDVEWLEDKVKSLKPVDEVEELANELYLSGGGSGKLTTPGGIEYWETIARKAIEIVKGKA